MTTAGYFTFASSAGNGLDDVVFLKLDGDTLESETYAYNAGNELTSQVINGTTLTFTYDQFGRMTQKTGGGKTGTYYYHYGDKLTKVASNFNGEGTVTYTYGGDQKRRSRAVSGGDTIKYRYDQGWGVVNEENGSGTLEATYVHHPGRQIGTVLATSAGSTASSGTWRYYYQDAIGSTRSVWDELGARTGKYEYTPFGGKYADHGDDITRKFTGHDWDSASRLYYTAYRYYSPDANRWLTRDPLGMVDGPNVYAYVVGNPVTMWDALGQCGAPDPEGEGSSGGGTGEEILWSKILNGQYNAEVFFIIFCLFALAVEFRTLWIASGRDRTSMGQAFKQGAIGALGIALTLAMLFATFPEDSADQQDIQAAFVGGGFGIAYGMLAAIEVAETIGTVLSGSFTGFMAGASCAVAGIQLLRTRGAI